MIVNDVIVNYYYANNKLWYVGNELGQEEDL